MPNFTPTQGRYLAFIKNHINRYRHPPAESEIAKALCVMPPSVNQMIRSLEQRRLITRTPGKARSIKILLADDEVPVWKRGVVTPNPKAMWTDQAPVSVEPHLQSFKRSYSDYYSKKMEAIRSHWPESYNPYNVP